MNAPTAFLSYAHESNTHHEWVRKLAVQLRLNGVESRLDQWELVPGDQIPVFMEKSIRESDFIVVICTPLYKTKSDLRQGGVGYEGAIITAELATGGSPRKFVPVLRGRDWRESAPSWLRGSYYIDGRADPFDAAEYERLIRALFQQHEVAPAVGAPPSFVTASSESGHQESRPQRAPASDTFVLRRLLEASPTDPHIREMAIQWLLEHGNSSDWAFIFVPVAEQDRPEAVLVDHALRWLELHSDSPSWSFVWMSLMKHRSDDPYLQELGKRYLQRT